MKKRIDYLDTAKGIAIIAVVMSHAITNSNDLLKIDHPVLLNWLSFFNVSTFFFINGFLYNENCVETPFKSILKKLKAYYIPYVSYNLFFMIFQNLFVKLHILDTSLRITDFKTFLFTLISVLFGKIQPLTGPMWFLRALILLSVIYIFVDSLSSRIFGGKFRYIINCLAGVMLLLLLYSGRAPGVFNFPTTCDSFLIFFLGVLYRKFDINKFVKKYLYPTVLISLTISLIIGNTIMVGIFGSLNKYLDITSMIISIIFVISISQINVVSKIRSLKYLGKGSMEIMALHFLTFKPVSFAFIKLYNLDISYLKELPVIKLTGHSDIWPVLYTVSGIVFPLIFFYVKSIIKARRTDN